MTLSLKKVFLGHIRINFHPYDMMLAGEEEEEEKLSLFNWFNVHFPLRATEIVVDIEVKIMNTRE
jgi:hypothetical protein